MKVDPFQCDCCSTGSDDLILIETRFEAQRCFAELQCRLCHALWVAELGPAGPEIDPFAPETADRGKWRVLALAPLVAN